MGRGLSAKRPNRKANSAEVQKPLECNTSSFDAEPKSAGVARSPAVKPLQRSWACELLGSHLADCSKAANRAPTRGLADCNVIGLYFGCCSGWCDPCNTFTPLLEHAYKTANRANPNRFEVVYIPFDRDQTEWDISVAGKPWKGLLWGERSRKLALQEHFHVTSLPTLVILKPNGSVVTMDGVKEVRRDEHLTRFPWLEVSWENLIGNLFVIPITQGDGTGTQRVNRSALGEGPLILVIASLADRELIQGCVKVYDWLKQHPVMVGRQQHFEMLFVSTDQNYDNFSRAFTDMQWPAIPFEKTAARRAQLADRFGAETGKLVVVSPEGKILNKDAFAAVTSPMNYETFPWEVATQPENTLTSCAVQCLDRVSNNCIIS